VGDQLLQAAGNANRAARSGDVVEYQPGRDASGEIGHFYFTLRPEHYGVDGVRSHFTACNLLDGRSHTLRHEALQLGLDCTMLRSQGVPAGLRSPGDALRISCEQVSRWRVVSRPEDLLLVFGEVPANRDTPSGRIQMSDIVTERSGNILRIQLNRPAKKNAMTLSMYITMAERRSGTCCALACHRRFVLCGQRSRGLHEEPASTRAKSAVAIDRLSGGS
jgi:hypothetical protein